MTEDLPAGLRWLAAGIGAICGSIVLVICLLIGLQVGGLAALLAGAVLGGTMLAITKGQGSALAGLQAAICTLGLVLTATVIEQTLAASHLREVVASEDSYIEVVAENILWRQSAGEEQAEGKQVILNETDTANAEELPPGVSPLEISPGLLQQAKERWAAMPEEEKQEIRNQRQRWLHHSGVGQGSLVRSGTSWANRLTFMLLASVCAMLFASAPAIFTFFSERYS